MSNPLQWTCPHCRRQRVDLDAAVRHLTNHHIWCLSCRAERLLCEALLRGEGWTTPMPEPHTHDRPRPAKA